TKAAKTSDGNRRFFARLTRGNEMSALGEKGLSFDLRIGTAADLETFFRHVGTALGVFTQGTNLDAFGRDPLRHIRLFDTQCSAFGQRFITAGGSALIGNTSYL